MPDTNRPISVVLDEDDLLELLHRAYLQHTCELDLLVTRGIELHDAPPEPDVLGYFFNVIGIPLDGNGFDRDRLYARWFDDIEPGFSNRKARDYMHWVRDQVSEYRGG